MIDYAVVHPDDVDDSYAGSDVPGEFRRLTRALGCEQLAATLIREPVEMWAISRRLDHNDATKIDDFWEASPDARRHAS
jgi:hypothetical protein